MFIYVMGCKKKMMYPGCMQIWINIPLDKKYIYILHELCYSLSNSNGSGCMPKKPRIKLYVADGYQSLYKNIGGEKIAALILCSTVKSIKNIWICNWSAGERYGDTSLFIETNWPARQLKTSGMSDILNRTVLAQPS